MIIRVSYIRIPSRSSSACSLLTPATSAPIYSSRSHENSSVVCSVPAAFGSVETNTTAHSESLYSQCKRQRQMNFIAGRSRAAYKRPIPLQRNETNCHSTAREANCHGCPAILRGLAGAFMAVGRHPAKALRSRVISYPQPKKQRMAYRNVSGTPLW